MDRLGNNFAKSQFLFLLSPILIKALLEVSVIVEGSPVRDILVPKFYNSKIVNTCGNITTIQPWLFPGSFCSGWEYTKNEPNQPLPEGSQALEVFKTTSVAILSKSFSPECAQHIFNNTVETEYYKRFVSRSPKELYKSYLASYNPDEKGRGELNRFRVDQFADLGDPHLIRRFSELVAISYCDRPGKIEHMPYLNLRMGKFVVDKAGFDYRLTFNWLIVSNEEQKTTALVLRGTDNLVDMLIDMSIEILAVNASMLPLPGYNDPSQVIGHVHKGFWKRYMNRRDAIAKELERVLSRKYRNQHQLVVVGHSLGAAWAFLEAVDLIVQRNLTLAAVYLYGMPLVGDQPFVDAMATVIGNDRFIRVVNQNDMIPHLGFTPDGRQPSAPNERFVVTCGGGSDFSAFRTCQGGQDPQCSLHYQCPEWTWRTHSELGRWSMREEFCNMTTAVPESVYAYHSN